MVITYLIHWYTATKYDYLKRCLLARSQIMRVCIPKISSNDLIVCIIQCYCYFDKLSSTWRLIYNFAYDMQRACATNIVTIRQNCRQVTRLIRWLLIRWLLIRWLLIRWLLIRWLLIRWLLSAYID
jgi:hypothetical protein